MIRSFSATARLNQKGQPQLTTEVVVELWLELHVFYVVVAELELCIPELIVIQVVLGLTSDVTQEAAVRRKDDHNASFVAGVSARTLLALREAKKNKS